MTYPAGKAYGDSRDTPSATSTDILIQQTAALCGPRPHGTNALQGSVGVGEREREAEEVSGSAAAVAEATVCGFVSGTPGILVLVACPCRDVIPSRGTLICLPASAFVAPVCQEEGRYEGPTLAHAIELFGGRRWNSGGDKSGAPKSSPLGLNDKAKKKKKALVRVSS